MRKNGTLNFILGDHLGSTSLVTDASGAVISQQYYKAWGETRYTTGTNPTDYTYTGQYSYTNDFGLMFYNARWYDPSLGRFVQADTIVPNGSQGLDRYAYVNNATLSFTDPSGHVPVDCYGTNYCGKSNSDLFSDGTRATYGRGLIGPTEPPGYQANHQSSGVPCGGGRIPEISPYTCGATGIPEESYPMFIGASPDDTFTDHSGGGGQDVVLNGQTVNPSYSGTGLKVLSGADLALTVFNLAYFNTSIPAHLTGNYVAGAVGYVTVNSSGTTYVVSVSVYNNTNFDLAIRSVQINSGPVIRSSTPSNTPVLTVVPQVVEPNNVGSMSIFPQIALSGNNSISINYVLGGNGFQTGLGTIIYTGPIGQ